MKAPNDTVTQDLLGDAYDLAGAVPPKPNKNAERARRYRERHGVTPMTINVESQVIADFNEWFERNHKGRKKGDVIGHLIKTQLLRKR